MTVQITYLGVTYRVAAGLPVVRALESAGVFIQHGSGCRQGFCGACALVYRTPDSPELRGALACRTLVVDGMDICRVPSVPIHRRDFDVERAECVEDLTDLYPELSNCTQCGACRICPVGIDVPKAIAVLQQKDLDTAAGLFQNCVSCGLCALRCPESISPSAVGLQAIRLVGYVNRASRPLEARVEACQRGDYRAELDAMCAAGVERIADQIAPLRAEAERSTRKRPRPRQR